MNLAELQRELKSDSLRAAYLLVGEEPLLRDDALAVLRAAVLRDAPPDFNLDVLHGSSVTPAAILDAVSLLPMLAERRLVILKEPEDRRGASAKALLDALETLVSKPAHGSSTVLVVIAAKADRRGRWVKAFGDGVIDCAAPTKTSEIAAFVREEAERQGLKLASGVADALAERIGPQFLMLRQELAKLALLAGPGETITQKNVADGSIDVAEESIWDLMDAIGNGRLAEAFVGLERIVSGGTPAPVVLGSLAAHFRKLARLRDGGSVAGPPFVTRKLQAQAQRYPKFRLETCLQAIHETDEILKGRGNLPLKLALERLVLHLAG